MLSLPSRAVPHVRALNLNYTAGKQHSPTTTTHHHHWWGQGAITETVHTCSENHLSMVNVKFTIETSFKSPSLFSCGVHRFSHSLFHCDFYGFTLFLEYTDLLFISS